MATLAIAGMIVVGIPTLAFAQATPPAETPSQTFDAATPPDSLTDDSVTTLSTGDAPAETPTAAPVADAPVADAPVAETPPVEEPAAKSDAEDGPGETTAPEESTAPEETETPTETKTPVVPEETPTPSPTEVAPKLKSLAAPNVEALVAAGQTTIKITKGGVRQSGGTVSGLEGITFEAHLGKRNSPVSGTITATCTTVSDGTCSMKVPDQTGGNNNPNGYWIVESTAGMPAGWHAVGSVGLGDYESTKTDTPYRFHTGNVSGQNNTRNVPGDSQVYPSSTANGNKNSTSWANVLDNNPWPAQCGLDMAIVFDQSTSINSGEMTQLRNAALAFVGADGLGPTPSRAALFTFSTDADKLLGLTSMSSSTLANTIDSNIRGSGNGYTNWDDALRTVANDTESYDVVLFLTDGDPTTYGNGSNTNTDVQMRFMDDAIFSANQVKAEGARIVPVGVAMTTNSNLNLAAISGPSDYYQVDAFEELQAQLKEIATENCGGTVTVQKQIVDASGAVVPNAPVADWTFTGSGADINNNPEQLTDEDGFVNYEINFAGQGTESLTVAETQKPGYSLYPQDAKNAVCTVGGQSRSVTNAGALGFTVDVAPSEIVSCVVKNRDDAASVTVNKQWFVNGQESALNVIPDGFTTSLSLTDQTAPLFGTVYDGYATGDVVNINESYTTPPACDAVVSTINETALGANGYDATLAQGANSYTITNTVDCATTLKLVKSVVGGPEVPSSWGLTATGPTAFTVNSGTVTAVTPGAGYALSEAGKAGFPNTRLYVQNGNWSCSLDGGGAVDGNTTNVPLGHAMVCTVSNSTAQLTLLKDVVAGDASPSAFELTATPTGDNTFGIPATTVDGAEAPNEANTFAIRPGLTYGLTEDGPNGYNQQSLGCWLPGQEMVPATSVTAAAGESWTCEFTNAAVSPQLKLTKVVAPPATVAPTEWTLTATADGDTVASGPGGTADFVDVPAGEDITLDETTTIGNASEFTASAWTCTINEGDPETLTAGNLPALSAGEKADCSITNSLKPVVPTITKTAGVPTPNADGTWTIGYDVVVTNPSNFTGINYKLSDDLQFGGDVTVNSATYQQTPDGVVHPFSPLTAPNNFTLSTELPAASSHTWHVTVNATVGTDADFTDPTLQECKDGDSGAVGFLNTAQLTYNGTTSDAEDCALPADPAVEKIGGTASDRGDGTWLLPYLIRVTNPSATTSVIYDLDDTFDFPAGVTIVGTPTVTPALHTPDPNVTGWTGVAPNVHVTNDIPLAAGGLHAYTVNVLVRIGTSVDPDSLLCPSTDGLNNTATVLSGNQDHSATACVPVLPPEITHTKTVTDTHQDADGTWSISYDVAVDNSSNVGGVYTLNDQLRFSTGMDLTGANYAVQLNGDDLGNGWNGGTEQNLATDRYLAPGTDTYTITVSGIVVAAGVIGSEAGLCPRDGITDTGAFNNRAILVTGGDTTTAADCDVPTNPTPTKTGATSAQQPDGSWNVSYTITVDNSEGKAGYYSLTDVPQWDAATVTINGWTVTGDPVNPNITEWTDGVIIPADAQQAIAAGATHVYNVVFNVDIPSGVPADTADCTTDEASGHGFVNEVQLTTGSDVLDDRDCTPMTDAGVPTVEKGDPTTVQNNDGTWSLVYPITVTGNADYITSYSLTDELSFAPLVFYNSASWQQLPDGPVTDWELLESPIQTLATDRTIGVDEVQTYQVSVNATVNKTAFEFPSTNTCTTTEVTPEVGFRNIATLTSGTSTQSDDGCSTPAQPAFTKTVNPGQPVQDGDNWVVSYTLTSTNTNPTQALVYDLTDTPDFPSGAVSIESRAVTSADVTVNPDWNSGDSDTVVSNETLPAGATHSFTVAVVFSVLDTADDTTVFQCASETNPDGQGLLNGAVLTSGDDYADQDCADIPVKVLVKKSWNINGTVMSGGDPLDGFSATLLLDPAPADDTTAWDTVEDGYAPNSLLNIDETNTVPVGCVLTKQEGLGDVTLDKPLNEFDVTNTVVCDQTLTLNKDVFNNHGGDAADVDWNVSATAPDDDDPTNFAGNGTASGDVTMGLTYTLTESSTEWDDNGYQVKTTWQCTSPQGDGAFTLVGEDGSQNASVSIDIYGASVECWIENEDIAPTLTLRKSVMPLGVTDPANWTLTGTPADDTAPIVTGNGHASETVVANVEYTLTEAPLADFPYGDDFTAGDWDCSVGADAATLGEDGTVTLAPGQNVTCLIVNTAKDAELTITKTLDSSEQLPNGTWDLEYTVSVQNLSELVPALYDLTDAPQFGDGITVNSASATGPSSQAADWSDSNEVLATDTEILASETDVYTISINATVTDSAWDNDTVECKPLGDGGFRNTAWLTTGDKPAVSATDCGEPTMSVQVDKVWIVNGVEYAEGEQPASLIAELVLDPVPDGTTSGWGEIEDGYELGSSVSIDETYQVADSCQLTDQDGLGNFELKDALNHFTVTNTVECEADPTIDKTLTSNVQNADGTWTLEYDVTVTNPSNVVPIEYDLEDELQFGEGIQVNAANATGPSDQAGDWNGDSNIVLATDQVVAYDDADVYTVTVNATVTAKAWTDDTVECLPDGTPGGFRNTATVRTGGVEASSTDSSDTTAFEASATACGEPGHATVAKTVLGAPTKNADGTWKVGYAITVTNGSEHALYYDLVDAPHFAAGTSIVGASAKVNGATIAGWDASKPLADDRVIGVAEGDVPTQDVYTIEFTVNISGVATATNAKCEGSGTGFFNTADMTNGTLSYTSSACAPFQIPVKPAHIASTGFDGGWLLPIGGGAILLGAVGLYLLRRRRPLADDQQM